MNNIIEFLKTLHATTILSIALITSLAGNAFQYTNPQAATPQGTELTPNQPVTDEPSTQPDQQLIEWQVTATFAITYAVNPRSRAFQDGYTVTVYHTDRTPTTVKAKKKPGPESVTWSPIPDGLPGVLSVEVHSVQATGKKADE
ncbi:MAG: hypothetical protein KDD28_27035 [Phaeodactylibacter sp.]|nr:hypothetical protein [Phaeodactylibacter sp.]